MHYWPLLAVALLCAIAACLLSAWGDGGMRPGLRGPLGMLGALTATLAALLCTSSFAIAHLGRAECAEHGQRSGVPTTYQALTGCYVDTGDRQVPYDRWIELTGH